MKQKTEQTFALINAGIVDNIIVATPEFAAILAASGDYEQVIEATESAAYIGGAYSGGAFVPAPPPAEPPAAVA